MAISRKGLPYRWDWDSDTARETFERRYTSKRQAQLRRKLDELARYGKGDVAKLTGYEGFFRLKVPPDRIIFYVGQESKTIWVVSIEPRSKSTYRL